MALIPWREAFEIGIESVDHEHRELIDLINQLHDRLGRSAAPEIVAGFLGEIYARISAHFALEERVMRDLEYDDYADHKNVFDEGGYVDLQEDLGDQLETWFGGHFRTKDARLHTFLEDRGA